MAQKTIILCDRHDKEEVEAKEKIPFAFNGQDYEVDLCGTHANELNKALKPFVDVARAVEARPTNGRKADHERAQKIRAWAKEHKLQCPDRGRIPRDVEEAYEANDPSKAKPATEIK